MNELSRNRTTHIIAAEINSIKEQTRKMVLYNSIEIGRRLSEAKIMVPHGEWGKWLQESVDYSQSTANNLMKIFEEYGSDQLSLFGDNAKSQAIGNLSYTQAVALLGIPESEREQFIAENDVENMSTRELQQAIKEKQEIEKQMKEAEKARDVLQKRYDSQTKQMAEHEKQVSKLRAELDDAKKAGDDAESEKIQEALEEAQGKIKQLENELKKKPIDVPAVVEKIPEEIEKELAELRKKVAQPSSAAAVKFKIQFDQLVVGFREILATLEEMPEQEKYKGAVKGLIGKMSERI